MLLCAPWSAVTMKETDKICNSIFLQYFGSKQFNVGIFGSKKSY